ncbi:M20 family metallo-hydrolase [Salsuginibacillus kocurii]|uniref:M20 family metallo-hydrolase n=1 Tax=Salsuginibacillus kocurii TaxID=427078 RepID=UPI00037C0715|nr:M20 family metallo-hydrolase [Salsuginibacillus kocurii]
MQEWLYRTLLDLNVTEQMQRREGFTRLSYTAEEAEAMQVFIEKAEELGLAVNKDSAGNLIARWEVEGTADEPSAVSTGSHLDTVENGGGYDGAAGVLCGLAAIKQLKDEGWSPARPLEVICFASEESARFGVSTIGSKAMSGLLEPEAVENVTDKHGVSIREAVESQGLSWNEITQAERRAHELHSFVELHIEQGTRIEQAKADIGVVSAIACPIRLQVKIEGQANHTGTTPMGQRSDALLAAVPIIEKVEEAAKKLSDQPGPPLVATASTINASPNVMNVIPGFVEVGIDIRSVSDQKKKDAAKQIKETCEQVAAEKSVDITVETLVNNPSIALDESLESVLQSVIEKVGYTAYPMESGAGHDVMNMSQRWNAGLLFVPCQDGLSHHPKEHAELEDLEKGALVLAEYMRTVTEKR